MERVSRPRIVLLFSTLLILGLITATLLLVVGTVEAQTTWTVDAIADTGAGAGTNGDLRYCITNAAAGDEIHFGIPGPGPHTITLDSPLPDIDKQLTIDGYTQSGAVEGPLGPGSTRVIMVEIDGSNDIGGPGLDLNDCSGCVIRGLAIRGAFDEYIAVRNADATNNTIEGNYLGTDAGGDDAYGCDGRGVLVEGGAHENLIGGLGLEDGNAGNLISSGGQGGWGSGVYIMSGCDGNVVRGNYIGTDCTGSIDFGNNNDGVTIYDCENTEIGGENPGEGNLVSGNDEHGIMVDGASTGTVIKGNRVGTNYAGDDSLGNSGNGIDITAGSLNNIVGGDTEAERNVVSGNTNTGILLEGPETSSNLVTGNYVGTDTNGDSAVANGSNGVEINGCSDNTVGGDSEEEKNVISGNTCHGVLIIGTDASQNRVTGNYIGTDPTGTADLGNGWHGVQIYDGPDNNTIGGESPGEGNLISGSGWDGIAISESSSQNYVWGNWIGLNATGDGAIANDGSGILVNTGSHHNTIGGNCADRRNVISGNHNHGIDIWDENTSSNQVVGNYLGTDPAGTIDLGNTCHGVQIANGPDDNTVGGDIETERNVISGNGNCGIMIFGEDTSNNQVSGNYVGTDFTGTADLGNEWHGVQVYGGSENLIGGDDPGEGNLASGNGWDGIAVSDGASQNYVRGNWAGLNATGDSAIANEGSGVGCYNGSHHNTIGGSTPGRRNVVSGNVCEGINIRDENTSNNQVIGNYVGTDIDGDSAVANGSEGVEMSGCSENTVGGDSEEERNVISGNTCHGVLIIGTGASQNRVTGNYIGTDYTGTADLGNGWHGVQIYDGPENNTVGGETPGEGNLISGNGWGGVDISENSVQNQVWGNWIGLNATGDGAIANDGSGIGLSSGATENTIGGSTSARRNVISGNGENGVAMYDESTSNNLIIGNYIGIDPDGDSAVANGDNGVNVWGPSNNTIGGEDSGEGNVISGNEGSGVQIGGETAAHNCVWGNLIGLDPSGEYAVSNTNFGIFIDSGAHENTVGGETEYKRNVVSGNDSVGIVIAYEGADNNRLIGNYVGTDISGNEGIANGQGGITVYQGSGNTIGGESAGEGNLVSGNYSHGINLVYTSQNSVWGNCIGLNANEDTGIPNSGSGIVITGGSQSNSIGGEIEAKSNLISGNGAHGLLLEEDGTGANDIERNYIGTDSTGTLDLGNALDGIYITQDADGNTVGGSQEAGNHILYNHRYGANINASDCEVSHNTITDNCGCHYDASASPLTYDGQDFTSTGPGEDTGCLYIRNALMGEMLSVTADGTAVPYADGVNDFNLCLCHANVGEIIYLTFYIRSDYYSDFASFETDFETAIPADIVLDHWEDSVFLAQGEGIDYIWAGSPSAATGFTSPPYLRPGEGQANAGVLLEDATGTTVTNNTIDDNSGHGVSMTGSTGNEVSDNRIRGNDNVGVVVWDENSYEDCLSQNSIYGNGGLGIDLGGDGVTPNDGDNNNPAKPNRGYNFPEFTRDHFPVDGSGNMKVSGTAPPDSSVELYRTGPTPDASGHGQGRTFLGAVSASAAGSFSTTLTGISRGEYVSAIAISPEGDPSGEGNTSEFSANIQARGPAAVTATKGVSAASGIASPGSTLTYTITIENTGGSDLPDPPGVEFTDDISGHTTYVQGSAQADSGSISYYESGNRIVWTGGIGAGEKVELSFEVAIDEDIEIGTRITNQGRVYWDATGSGTRNSSALTGNPSDPGGEEPTDVVVEKVLGSTRWFVAEGSTGGGFDTYIMLQNPGDHEGRAEVTFTTDYGPQDPLDVTLGPGSRATVRVADYVPDTWGVSTIIESDVPIVAERSMYWNKGLVGESDVQGEPGPYDMRSGHANLGTPYESVHRASGLKAGANMRYFAEGATAGGFDTWILLCNPGEVEASAQVSLMTEKGISAEETLTVPPLSRKTVHLDDYLPDDFEVATRVTSDNPLVVERSMYWDPEARVLQPDCMRGGHSNDGAPSPATEWFLAEGSSGGGFETYVLLQNPGEEEAEVTATFTDSAGRATTESLTMAACSRATLKISDYVPDELQVSTRITSDRPVVAERSMYWDKGAAGEPYEMRDGHSTVGVLTSGRTWMVPEGSTVAGFDSWVLLANPTDRQANVAVTFMTPDGPREPVDIPVGPNSRYSIHVNDYVKDEFQVSTLIDSSVRLVVERAMYWSSGEWSGIEPFEMMGGHSAAGVDP